MSSMSPFLRMCKAVWEEEKNMLFKIVFCYNLFILDRSSWTPSRMKFKLDVRSCVTICSSIALSFNRKSNIQQLFTPLLCIWAFCYSFISVSNSVCLFLFIAFCQFVVPVSFPLSFLLSSFWLRQSWYMCQHPQHLSTTSIFLAIYMLSHSYFSLSVCYTLFLILFCLSFFPYSSAHFRLLCR